MRSVFESLEEKQWSLFYIPSKIDLEDILKEILIDSFLGRCRFAFHAARGKGNIIFFLGKTAA